MERVNVYLVVWSSISDPLYPSTYTTLDRADADNVYNDWLQDVDEDEDYLIIHTNSVPIPAPLQSKFAIGT